MEDKTWYWQDYSGLHGPLTLEAAEAANQKFGIGRPVVQPYRHRRSQNKNRDTP